ncbi:MAG: aminoacyl-tRNA hydrolase [Clostridiales bacterium]|nr:aminoacyl-tRNA hydrolase [Clostridiales bacterium]
MVLIAGLGNPGAQYERTRHNAGFEALDILSKSVGIAIDRARFRSLVGESTIAGKRVVLLKPQTYMNLSGQAVAEAMRWYKLQPEQVLVISDDIDLPPGVIRVRMKGGAGTHNGWKSIIAETGTGDFPRIRIGTGAPPIYFDLAAWVLAKHDETTRPLMEEAFEAAAKAAVCFVEHGINLTMNRFNRRHDEEPTV